jgi:hypothetical protein
MTHNRLFRWPLALALVLALTASCSSPTSPAEEEMIFEVAPAKVHCASLVEQECFQVRSSSAAPWTYFYESISGFVYEPGYLYSIRVAMRVIPNPPLDASGRSYRLVAILTKTAAS